MDRNKRILTGLDHSQYEHPFDQKALSTLENTPGLSLVGNFITKHTIEKIYTVQYTGSNLKVTPDNYPKIYDYLQYACQILDMPKVPELYIEWGYSINAFTVGSENPIIVLNSGLIDLCDDEEIMFIIGHECGHIKSNHMLYHMMAQVINLFIDSIPLGNLAAAPIQYALYYWDRMSEFTADRAGLLCCQNKDAAIRAFMKMAGTPIKEFNSLNYETFIQQAADFKQLDYDAMSKVIKFISIMDASHPWTVMRAAELLNWINSGDYKLLIDMGHAPIQINSTTHTTVSHKPQVTVKPKPQLTIKETTAPKPLLTIKEKKQVDKIEIKSVSQQQVESDTPCDIVIRETENDNEVTLEGVVLSQLAATDLIQRLVAEKILNESEEYEYYIEDKLNRRVMPDDTRSLLDLGYIDGDVVRVGKSLKEHKVINIKNISTGNIVHAEGVALDAVSAYDLIEQLKVAGILNENTTYLIIDKEGHALSIEDKRTLFELGFTYGNTINVLIEDSNVGMSEHLTNE